METGATLSSGTVPVTTLRGAVVVGRGSAAFETMVSLVDRLPLMVAPRWVSTPTQPIALADIIRYLAGVAGPTDALGESFDVGGPEILTYGEMIQRIARLRGRRSLILEVPARARDCPHTGCTSSRPSARPLPAHSSRACETRRWRTPTASDACSRFPSRASVSFLAFTSDYESRKRLAVGPCAELGARRAAERRPARHGSTSTTAACVRGAQLARDPDTRQPACLCSWRGLAFARARQPARDSRPRLPGYGCKPWGSG